MTAQTVWSIGSRIFTAHQIRDTTDLTASQRMRFDEYVERLGQIDASACPSGLESDDWDQYAVQLIAKMDRTPIGSFRLIPCNKPYLLSEACFNGRQFVLPEVHPKSRRIINPEETVEASRWVGRAVKLDDNTSVLTSMLLLQEGIRYSLENGIKFWICAIGVQQVANLRADGWPFIDIVPGAPHEYHGAQVAVCILEVREYFCRRTL